MCYYKSTIDTDIGIAVYITFRPSVFCVYVDCIVYIAVFKCRAYKAFQLWKQPPKFPLVADPRTRSTHDSLRPYESTTQTACRSVHLLLQDSRLCLQT